jgi:hypothetical protein
LPCLQQWRDGDVGFHDGAVRDAQAALAAAAHPDAEELLRSLALFELDGEQWIRPEWRYPH